MTLLPMLASPTSSASGRRGVVFEDLMASGDWVADVKMDGVRGLVNYDPLTARPLVITNRNGVDITHRYPELVTPLTKALKGHGPNRLMIDGEIVARDNRFETTLLRDQQESPGRIAALAERHPCIFVAFDVPEFGTQWQERRRKLVEILEGHAGKHLITTQVSQDSGFLARTRELEMEGAIAKHINGRYEFGKRSKMWLKFKNTFRVTCLVAGYYPGQGRRKDFGGMVLALLDDNGGVVEVGRVGTGFTEAQIPKLKESLDSGTVLVVEIECTNQTSAGQLRFPVFKGIRTDVAVSDCKIGQLAFLPTM